MLSVRKASANLFCALSFPNGLLWIQRLSRLKRERLIKRFAKVSQG